MTKQERLQEALRTMNFYELAKITYERSEPMKIKVNQIPSDERLELYGNRFFTQTQLREIREM